jgi:signal transduction histidine kinase
VQLLGWIIKITHFGSIFLKTKIHTKESKDFIKFSIKGTGATFNQQTLSSAFEISAGLLSADSVIGAKLNLLTSKAIVELLGGDFWIKTQSGKNSSIKFTLPISDFHVIRN